MFDIVSVPPDDIDHWTVTLSSDHRRPSAHEVDDEQNSLHPVNNKGPSVTQLTNASDPPKLSYLRTQARPDCGLPRAGARTQEQRGCD
ncbi:MAG: hypothetical protein R2882_11925 [Gemmatimonadales bacterium]